MIPTRNKLKFNEETRLILPDRNASIAFSPTINEYVLIVMVPWIAWYERYYYITEEEYNEAKKDSKYKVSRIFLL